MSILDSSFNAARTHQHCQRHLWIPGLCGLKLPKALSACGSASVFVCTCSDARYINVYCGTRHARFTFKNHLIFCCAKDIKLIRMKKLSHNVVLSYLLWNWGRKTLIPSPCPMKLWYLILTWTKLPALMNKLNNNNTLYFKE